jgi:Flp pilus assembly protein TadD
MPTVDQVLAQLWAHHQRGNLRGAEAGYRNLLEKVPRNANAHVYLGIALFDQQRYAEAVEAYRAALQVQHFFPVAWNNLGNALRMVGEVEEADRAFATALQQKPEYATAMKNRGTLWIWAGEIERGLQWYDHALGRNPEDAELHRNLGVIYLLQGRYDEGWREYRYRWKLPGLQRPRLSSPIWEGQPLEGKTIFVYPEQGLGDAIQFSRGIARLRDRGAEVVFGCEPKLVPLFSGLRDVGRIVPVGGQLGRIDYHASLVEVIDHTWSDLADIDGSPYLTLPENLVAYWGGRLRDVGGLRVGICWQGNRQHHADSYRSIALQTLRPLAELPEVTLVSLQFGDGREQLEGVEFAERIVQPPADIDRSGGAFLDTAAIMQHVDLVITTDTSCGHLAGALGVPTWLLLSKVPDWRWGLAGERTPWYDQHRLWRQSTVGDWSSVIQAVEKGVRHLFGRIGKRGKH